jgi:hypothetical protein
MAEQHGDVLVIRVGTAAADVYKDVTEEQCLKIVRDQAPGLLDKLSAANTRLAALEREVITNPDNAVDYYLLQAAQARADELLNADLEGLSESEQFSRIEEYHRYSSIGSALLYSEKNFKGSSKFFTVTWPNMKWWPYRFNNKASSAKAWGANILFTRSWYRGRRLFLIGIPFVQFEDLSVFDFDNVASSFMSLP